MKRPSLRRWLRTAALAGGYLALSASAVPGCTEVFITDYDAGSGPADGGRGRPDASAGFDAGLQCAVEIDAVDLEELYPVELGGIGPAFPAGVSDVAIAPDGNGGYLVAAVMSLVGTQFVDLPMNGLGQGQDAGFLPCGQAGVNAGSCPFGSVSLITLSSTKPPTLVAGFQPLGTQGTSTSVYACWSPFNRSQPTGQAINLQNAFPNFQLGLIRAAYFDGIMALAASDFFNGQDWVAMDPSEGDCPNDGAQIVTSDGIGDAIAPSESLAMSPFEVAVVEGNSNTLSVYSLPDGGGWQIQLPLAATLRAAPAVAADGTVVTALVADDEQGVELFINDINHFNPITDGGSIGPPTAAGLSATNCGVGCALGAWMQQSDAGVLTPTYAFISPTGSLQKGTLTPWTKYIRDYPGPTTAVAYQPGSAAIAYVVSDQYLCVGDAGCATESHVRVSLCTPP